MSSSLLSLVFSEVDRHVSSIISVKSTHEEWTMTLRLVLGGAELASQFEFGCVVRLAEADGER